MLSVLLLTSLLQFSNLWNIINLFSERDIRKGVFTTSLCLCILSFAISLSLYFVYLSISHQNKVYHKNILLGFVFASFTTVFASIFLKMGLLSHDNIPKHVSDKIGISAEFALGSGFVCSGSYAILICI